MLGLHWADIIVLVVYFAGMSVIGLKIARRIASMSDFFMPRKANSALMIMHTFGSGTHADQAVVVASKTFTNGLSGIWYQWCYLFPTPFYWLLAAIMRRFRAITTGDVFEARFGPSVARLFAVVGIINMVVAIAMMLKGSSAVIDASTAGKIPADVSIWVMMTVILIYGLAGGLEAVIIADFIQGTLTIVFSFMLLPFILHAVGGMAGIRAAISDPQMLSMVAPSEIGVFYVVVIAINALVGLVSQPHLMGNCAAGKTETEGRFGLTCGNFIKRICTIAWCLTGLAAVVYFSGRDINPDHIFGLVAAEFLPKISFGVLGLFLASLLTSALGSCDSAMIASAGLFTENIYKKLLPGRDQKHYIFVARVTSLAVVAAGAMFAYSLPNVGKGLEVFWIISAMMGIAFWLGLFWRRANAAGAWASTLTSFAVWGLTTRPFFIDWLGVLPAAQSLGLIFIRGGTAEMYMPWQMVFYLSAGVIAGVVASCVTKPTAKEKIDNFYTLLQTPVTPNEKVLVPCTLPEGVAPGRGRKIFPNTNIELLVPSPIAVIGFIASWLTVAIIIYVFFIIAMP